MTESERIDYIGREGERALSSWAEQVGIICNPASKDSGGWDHILQLPVLLAKEEVVTSLDHLPLRGSCLIQVKSTDNAWEPRVKLSNIRRFIEWPGPAFFLVHIFAGKNTPQESYLIPFDKVWVERALKRLRETPVGHRDELHKLEMTVNWEPHHRLLSLDGEGLRDALARHVGDHPALYVEEKARWRRNAGIEDAPYHMSFTVHGSEAGSSAEELAIDFSLGLSSHLPATLNVLEEVRWGIPVPVAPALPSDVLLSFSRLEPQARGDLAFISEDGARRMQLPAGLYTPLGLLPNIPPERSRLRFATPLFDFFIKGPLTEVEFVQGHFDWDKHFPLHVMGNTADLMSLLATGLSDGRHVTLRLAFATGGKTLRLPSYKIAPLKLSPQILHWARAARDAWDIARTLNLALAEEIPLGDLLRYSLGYEQCRPLLIPRADVISWEMPLSGEEAPDDGAEIGIPLATRCRLGRSIIYVGAAVYGRARIEERAGGRYVRLGSPALHPTSHRIFDAPDERDTALGGESDIAPDEEFDTAIRWLLNRGAKVYDPRF